MRQLKIFMMMFSLFGVVLAAAGATFAHAEEIHVTEPVTQPLKEVVKTQAFGVYDKIVAECAKKVMGMSPAEAAKTGNKAALRMDADKTKKIQNCMNEKGIDAHFENHFIGYKDQKGPLALDPAKAAELQEIQEKLDRANNLSSPETVLTPAAEIVPVPTPVTPVLPNVLPEDYKPKDTATKKYWVAPQ